MIKNGVKFLQRRLYTYINSWPGFTVVLLLCAALMSIAISTLANPCRYSILAGIYDPCVTDILFF
jgi:hypothetical protein